MAAKKTNILQRITDVANKGIPYNYVVGAKDTSGGGIPFNVKLSIDPDFKKTVIKSITILSVGIGLGVVAGIVITKRRG